MKRSFLNLEGISNLESCRLFNYRNVGLCEQERGGRKKGRAVRGNMSWRRHSRLSHRNALVHMKQMNDPRMNRNAEHELQMVCMTGAPLTILGWNRNGGYKQPNGVLQTEVRSCTNMLVDMICRVRTAMLTTVSTRTRIFKILKTVI